MNQAVYSGSQSITALRRWLDRCGAPVLLVTGNRSFEQCGAAEMLAPLLRHREVTRLAVKRTNPEAGEIDRQLSEIGDRRVRVIIAIGGGSVIDTAKLIKSFHGSGRSVRASLDSDAHTPAPDGAPLLAVPTTAGSGSESTHFAVVYSGGKKYSHAAATLLPNACFLVPSLLHSMPQRQRAISALDALCQAIESYWSIRSTSESRRQAVEALRILWPVLQRDPEGTQAESAPALSEASNLAGRAINIARTTAAHALSYPFTGRFGLPHGHAVAVMLPGVFQANSRIETADCVDSRGAAFVRSRIGELAALLGRNSPVEAAEAIRRLVRHLGLEQSLPELGIDCRDTISGLCNDAVGNERMANNPRRLEPETISDILTKPC